MKFNYEEDDDDDEREGRHGRDREGSEGKSEKSNRKAQRNKAKNKSNTKGIVKWGEEERHRDTKRSKEGDRGKGVGRSIAIANISK